MQTKYTQRWVYLLHYLNDGLFCDYYMNTKSASEKNINRIDFVEVLDNHLGNRVSLSCRVGVAIWGEMFTLEAGHGLCRWDLTRDGMRLGIGEHCISSVTRKMDGTLAISIL